MAKINIDYVFNLENGSTRKVSVNDVKENIQASEIMALADLFIEKNSHYNGSPFTSLKKCSKFVIDEEVIV